LTTAYFRATSGAARDAVSSLRVAAPQNLSQNHNSRTYQGADPQGHDALGVRRHDARSLRNGLGRYQALAPAGQRERLRAGRAACLRVGTADRAERPPDARVQRRVQPGEHADVIDARERGGRPRRPRRNAARPDSAAAPRELCTTDS
jgi:hypothetical protein